MIFSNCMKVCDFVAIATNIETYSDIQKVVNVFWAIFKDPIARTYSLYLKKHTFLWVIVLFLYVVGKYIENVTLNQHMKKKNL